MAVLLQDDLLTLVVDTGIELGESLERGGQHLQKDGRDGQLSACLLYPGTKPLAGLF